MYVRNRTSEVRRLLWEVARLQALARRANQFASCFPLYDSQLTASAFHMILAALRRDLEKESWLVTEIASREEIFDRAPPAGKKEARRRRNG